MKHSIKYLVSSISGFTLVELMIVMAILSSLVGLVAGGFRSAQMRGRDAQRKSDLKQIANALELFFSDHRKYPDADNGSIKACPFDPDGATSQTCIWGSSDLGDGKTTYFQNLPKDPAKDLSYYYRLPASGNLKFQLFARLENKEDVA